MSQDKWMRAVGEIDEALVEELLEQDSRPAPSSAKQKIKRLWWVPIPAVAVCLCIAIGLYHLAPLLLMNPFENPTDPSKPPVSGEVQPRPPVSGELQPWSPEVGEDVPVVEVPAKITDHSYNYYFLYDIYDTSSFIGALTGWYATRKIPAGEALTLTPISTEAYLPIYEEANSFSKDMLDSFIQQWLPAAGELTGIRETEYIINYSGLSGLPSPISYSAIIGSYDTKQYVQFRGSENSLLAFQCPAEAIARQEYFPSFPSSDSDEAILSALDDGITYLKELLGLEIQSIRIHRLLDNSLYVSSSSLLSTGNLTVTLQGYPPEGSQAYPNEIASTPAYTLTLQYRYSDWQNSDQLVLDKLIYGESLDTANYFFTVGKAKTIPLSEAEELLDAGYVYSNIKCLLCREQKSDVDFSDYDAVGLVYRQGQVGKSSWSVPFYAFYKHTQTDEDGSNNYAIAYVPAVEITGLEEYFAECTEEHTHISDTIID